MLLGEGHDVRTAEDARAGLVLLGAERVELVVAEADDEVTPGLLRAAGAARIVLTALPSEVERAVALAKDGPHDVIRKPIDPGLLVLAVRRAAPREAPSATPDRPLVVVSRIVRKAVSQARSARGSRLPVLVVGEPGTGRTTFARLAASPERPPDVLPDGLAPELALANLEAWLDDASGRTLIVEEAQTLAPALQARLLAHLAAPGPHAVRIIATATPELRQLAGDGAFSPALFLALGGIVIDLPPLTRRREDLPVLAQEALARAREIVGKPELRLAKESLRVLARKPLAGNVRELGTVILRAAAACNGKTIFPHDLVFDEAAPSPPDDPETFTMPRGIWELPFAEAKERATVAFARAYFHKLLRDTDGNVSEAARRSGLDRANLRRARRRYEKPR